MTHDVDQPDPLCMGDDPCVCQQLMDARYAAYAEGHTAGYTRGYNDHAASAQRWQDTHGAYRQHGGGENP